MPTYKYHIALLGGGTIGLSMAALHLRRSDTKVTIYDPRLNIEAEVQATLPTYLTKAPSTSSTSSEPAEGTDIIASLISTNRLTIAKTIQEAVQSANIIQEQSPEIKTSKQALWKEVSLYADTNAHLWSSSSGIAASLQGSLCEPTIKERLLVTHPFNPPHILPLIEIVPGPETLPERMEFAKSYFGDVPGPESNQGGYYRPVVLNKEIEGFVGNRLAFALLREACYLVGEGVVSVEDLDTLVMASLGPRWAGSGVFESYHAGGGEGGIGAFIQKLAPTMNGVWSGLGQVDVSVDGDDATDESWRGTVVKQSEAAYGPSASPESRRKKEVMLKGVVEMQKKCL
ncbi:hypothetical protein N7493_005787 [Penicillium malachiteum]|uniref:L-gulonate 3-dehydrogenase n=1 Tax=Penicillium malachiteum TaxID=1324776 RepID=A0AAD6HNC2_9EURO|nr:hypothetical protein N7493_005787 [Penicillium malachiteum]